ncbi:xylose isomerase domain-containing protein [Mycobacterium tuberculosis]|nr:xylose isomerase domain-containing protein [Mycobacterium tuberculosis]
MHPGVPNSGPNDLALSNRLSINEFMLPDSVFEDDLETCSRAGASGMGIWEERLGSGRDSELAELFDESGMSATVCVSATPSILPLTFFGGPYDPAERIERLIASIRRFEPFGPSQFLTITGADASISRSEQRRIIIEGYRQAGGAAAEIGALVGIEPMRNRPNDSLVASVAEAADLVAEIDTEGVGILYDIWHHWDSPTVLEDIKSYASLFTAVQLGDWPDRPNPGTDRAIPGEGVIPLDRIFDALESAGYTGWYDLELVADPLAEDSLLRLDRDEMLKRSINGLEAAWAKAGVNRNPEH